MTELGWTAVAQRSRIELSRSDRCTMGLHEPTTSHVHAPCERPTASGWIIEATDAWAFEPFFEADRWCLYRVTQA